MGVTNFEHNLNTLAYAMQSGLQCQIIVKRIDTGYYKYTAGINYEPHRGMNVYVIKDSLGGKRLGVVYLDRITPQGIEYKDTCGMIIPNRISIELVNFYRALAIKMGWIK